MAIRNTEQISAFKSQSSLGREANWCRARIPGSLGFLYIQVAPSWMQAQPVILLPSWIPAQGETQWD